MTVNPAFAGTLESGDIRVQLSPSEAPGIHVNLESSVEHQFGEQIRNVIRETLSDFGLKDVNVSAIDKGALDCTIRARVTAAAVRATGKDVWKD